MIAQKLKAKEKQIPPPAGLSRTSASVNTRAWFKVVFRWLSSLMTAKRQLVLLVVYIRIEAVSRTHEKGRKINTWVVVFA